jgi:hypothetical protein
LTRGAADVRCNTRAGKIERVCQAFARWRV